MLEIEHPLTGEKLQVANKDFKFQMEFYDAIRAYENLGSGWRLPTIEELELMYEKLHKKGIGNFHNDYYWSSSENDTSYAWLQYFGSGAQGFNFESLHLLRACSSGFLTIYLFNYLRQGIGA